MDCEIDAALDESLFDFLGEKPLAAQFGERPVEHRIARGLDDDDFGSLVGKLSVRRGQERAHHIGLGQRQRAAARSDA